MGNWYKYLLISFFVSVPAMEAVDVTWVPSPNYGERIDKSTGQHVDKPTMLVMHYTVSNLTETLQIFQDPASQVSAHYTVAENGTIYQHVDEKYRAWHAGAGQWRGTQDVNTYSIGIEHVNAGYRESPDQPPGIIVPGSPYEWYEFQTAQINASIALAKEIVQRYSMKPRNVFGHGDSAVGRKVDPGPLYPWSEYAKHGIGAWIFEEKKEEDYFQTYDEDKSCVLAMQMKLYKYGYTGVPLDGQFDDATRNTVAAFQMHYRQANISGLIDKETMRMIDALLRKYPS